MGRRNPPARWVLPATIDPTERRCMMIPVPEDPQHIAAFRGALMHLAEAHKWSNDPTHKAREVALVWRNIIDGLEWGCGVEDAECRNFNTSAGFITYEPQNPFTEPNLIPAGYILPPFYVVYDNTLPEFLGYEVGDVLTDLSRFYGGTGVITDPESGFSRFRVSVTGIGRVQIYFLNVPLGGMALVTADGDPLSANIVELQVDLFSIPIEDNEVVIHEVEFDTVGAHYVDVTFVPRVNDEAPFVFFGGGIRQIRLCGFEEVTDVPVFDIRQKPDAPCIIQKTDDGIIWADAVDMTKCPPKIRVNNGVIQWYNEDTDTWEDVDTGDERVDGDAPVPYAGNPDGNCLAAENITAVYQSALTEIRAGITASRDLVAIAAGISGIMTAFMPLAIVTTVAFGLTAAALAVGGAGLDDMLDAESLTEFKCSIYCNIQTDGSITAADFTALRTDMATWAATVELEIINIWLDAFGSVGLQRQAKAGGITTGDCSDCEDCYEPPVSPWHVPDGTEDPASSFGSDTRGTAVEVGWQAEQRSDYFEICLYANVVDEDHAGQELKVWTQWTADGLYGHEVWNFFTGSNNVFQPHIQGGVWEDFTFSFANSLPIDGTEVLQLTTSDLSTKNYDAMQLRLRSYSEFKITRVEWFTP